MIGIQTKRRCRMTQEEKQERMAITDGPSELDLIYSLMREEDVMFTIDGCKVPTIIDGLEIPRVDGVKLCTGNGSRRLWAIKGHFNMLNGLKRDKFSSHRFHGAFYYENGRHGWVVIEK